MCGLILLDSSCHSFWWRVKPVLFASWWQTVGLGRSILSDRSRRPPVGLRPTKIATSVIIVVREIHWFLVLQPYLSKIGDRFQPPAVVGQFVGWELLKSHLEFLFGNAKHFAVLQHATVEFRKQLKYVSHRLLKCYWSAEVDKCWKYDHFFNQFLFPISAAWVDDT